MSCKSIRPRILDLALDESLGDSATRAHLDSCAGCRDELAARRALLAAIDRVLVEELRQEPSPLLSARVRQAIENEAVGPSAWWHGANRKGWVSAAATVTLALLVGLAVHERLIPIDEPVSIEPAQSTDTRKSTSGQSSAEARSSLTGADRWAQPTPIHRGASPGAVGRLPDGKPARPRRTHLEDASRLASQAQGFSEVIVPPGEMAAALRLSAASAVHPLLVSTPEENEAATKQPLEPLSIEKIEIAPLVLEPIGVGAPEPETAARS